MDWIKRRGVKDVVICSAFMVTMSMLTLILPAVIIPHLNPVMP